MTTRFDLPADAISSSPPISVEPLSCLGFDLAWTTSPEVQYVTLKPGKTPNPRRPQSLTVLTLNKDEQFGEWKLKAIVVVQLRRRRKEWIATTWLEHIAEYGVGPSDNEAIQDLVGSLGEYREVLKRRRASLDQSAVAELELLDRLVERAPQPVD